MGVGGEKIFQFVAALVITPPPLAPIRATAAPLVHIMTSVIVSLELFYSLSFTSPFCSTMLTNVLSIFESRVVNHIPHETPFLQNNVM